VLDHAEAAAGQKEGRALLHLGREVHGGESLAGAGRTVEEQAALQMTAGCEEGLAVAREPLAPRRTVRRVTRT
jgi:hypothetical protein